MSDSVKGLALLAQERDNILLAEVAAWLHDWQKTIPFWTKLGATFNPGDVSSVLDGFRPAIPLTSSTSSSLKEIIEQGRNPTQAKHSSDWRIRLLGICHDVAHLDKPELEGLGERTRLIASVFGFEVSPSEASQQLLKAVKHIRRRHLFLEKLEEAFDEAVGDDRRPINEVTLRDWGSATAALWKAMAARNILEKQVEDAFQWRLLRIDFDGLRFLERTPAISDLVGRRAALQAALDEVRTLLEVTYPLGNEVYRDENGSAFVVPALDGDDTDGNRLLGLIETHILDTLRQGELGGELRPRIHVTVADKQAAVLHDVLDPKKKPPPPVAPFHDSMRCWWQGEAADVCSACGVRPQGWGAPNASQECKARGRNVCYVCLERRGRRAQKWAQARHDQDDEKRKPWERTIWLDEVADENGRLALIVGKFDLTHWLNGDMIQTLLVVCDAANNTYESKNPSFARIQRVWRTTQQFWRNVQDRDIPSIARLEQQRLSIAVTNADELQHRLGDYHAYETEINGRRLSVIWDSQDTCLLTADNLLAWDTAGAKAILERLPDELPLSDPGGYGRRRRERISARIDRERSHVIPVQYSPTIGLLTQPASFMTLVPAQVALDVATKISRRYELEMSKVRNRLPLSLGLVFFDRRQPLFSALDAGRRLLKHAFKSQTYTVVGDPKIRSRSDAPSHLDHPHFEKWLDIKLDGQADETLLWRVSLKMGDGDTDDEWYPYVRVYRDGDGNPPAGRIQFEHPQYPGQQWVYAKCLKKGDEVSFAPSRFSCLHLDTSARRFEAGQKTRPLEELERITGVWNKLRGLAKENRLSTNRLHAIVTLLVTKEERWGTDSDEYRQLAETVLHTEGLDTLTVSDLTSCRLQTAFTLYHRILKRSLQEEAT